MLSHTPVGSCCRSVRGSPLHTHTFQSHRGLSSNPTLTTCLSFSRLWSLPLSGDTSASHTGTTVRMTETECKVQGPRVQRAMGSRGTEATEGQSTMPGHSWSPRKLPYPQERRKREQPMNSLSLEGRQRRWLPGEGEIPEGFSKEAALTWVLKD